MPSAKQIGIGSIILGVILLIAVAIMGMNGLMAGPAINLIVSGVVFIAVGALTLIISAGAKIVMER
jgi:hypothetical protein